MKKSAHHLLFALSFCTISAAYAAGEMLPQHLQQIEGLQRRADTLAFGDLGSDNYHLAKARAWLDLALSEYHEKDTTGVAVAAIEQAESLLGALEKKQTDIAMNMPAQTPGSEAVRPDLSEKISKLKSHEKFSCGQRPIAEAEVYLVWTGHEKAESGWSHAQSYARSAENLVYNAEVAIQNCATAPAVVTTAPLVAEPVIVPPPTEVVEKISLASDALFEFGKATLGASALKPLSQLMEKINSMSTVEEITLVGHTDRLRSDGHQERNQVLSEKRAESIKQYLISKGVAAEKIHASGVGSSSSNVMCAKDMPKAKQIICLEPNRRVEIILRGVR